MTTGAPILEATCMLGAHEVATIAESFDLHGTIQQSTYTTVGAEGTNVNRGKESWMLDMVFIDGQAAAEAQGLLYPLLGTKVAFVIRHDDGAIGVANPQYTGTLLIGGEWSLLPAPADGAVPKITCSFQVDGKPAKAVT